MTPGARLVERFAANIIAQTSAQEACDVGKANACARRYLAAFNQLRAMGDEGRELLVPLLRHERADVRAMTAVFLLRHCEVAARAVLESEGRGTGLVAFGARQALLRWAEGTWTLDPPQ